MSIYTYQGTNLLNFTNVLDFGAKGNGVADDSYSIQNALYSCSQTGGIIYFPKGTYKHNDGLLFYSNQTLLFENGAILVGNTSGASVRTILDSSWTEYNGVHDCRIIGAVFDSNVAMPDTGVVLAHCKNIIFEKCVFKNSEGKYHNIEVNSAYNVKFLNCEFEGDGKTAGTGEIMQIDGAVNSTAAPWDGMNIDGTISKYIDIDGCLFHGNNTSPAIGNHTDMAHKYIKIHNCIFDSFTGSRGAIDFVDSMRDVDIYNNYFVDCTKGIGGDGHSSFYIHDNRFVNCTTPISSSASIKHNNMINGVYTA